MQTHSISVPKHNECLRMYVFTHKYIQTCITYIVYIRKSIRMYMYIVHTFTRTRIETNRCACAFMYVEKHKGCIYLGLVGRVVLILRKNDVRFFKPNTIKKKRSHGRNKTWSRTGKDRDRYMGNQSQ